MTPEEQAVIKAARAFVKHDNPEAFIRLRRALERLDGKDVDPEPPVWVPATWGDVGKGDRVRYQGHETVVGMCLHSPEAGTCTVKVRGRSYEYDLIEPVEILMDRKRRAEHEL
jgi:hypothetical protein